VLGQVIAVVVVAASAHENAVGIALLDKVAADTDAVEKALVDQGFKTAVVAHREKVGIAVEVVEGNPAQTGTTSLALTHSGSSPLSRTPQMRGMVT
jgi:hypothetical protein